MSALSDAKRFLWLAGVETGDDPVQLLKDLVVEVERAGFNAALASTNIKQSARIGELETELREVRKKLTANIEYLQSQLDADRQMKRISQLETQLKEARAQTAAFRRVVVQKSSTDSKP